MDPTAFSVSETASPNAVPKPIAPTVQQQAETERSPLVSHKRVERRLGQPPSARVLARHDPAPHALLLKEVRHRHAVLVQSIVDKLPRNRQDLMFIRHSAPELGVGRGSEHWVVTSEAQDRRAMHHDRRMDDANALVPPSKRPELRVGRRSMVPAPHLRTRCIDLNDVRANYDHLRLARHQRKLSFQSFGQAHVVVVDDCHPRMTRECQTPIEAGSLSAVLLTHHPDARIPRGIPRQNLGGGVSRAIVDDQELEGGMRLSQDALNGCRNVASPL